MEPQSELYVGVAKKDDGAYDFSKALKVQPDTLRISDPIVNRLRGPLLVDQQKERRYSKYQDDLIKMDSEGKLATWFANLLNDVRLTKNTPGSEDITETDLQSLVISIDDEEIQHIRRQTGHKFERPVFKLSFGDYDKVYRKLVGHGGSGGCTLFGGGIDENHITKGVSVIIAPSIGPNIVHEIDHLIDPHFHKRAPREAILEEFAAYYRGTFTPTIYTTTTRQNGHETVTQREVYDKLRSISEVLKGDLYQHYADAFGNTADYERRVDEIGDVIERIEKHMAKPDVQKAIFNAESYSDLLHLADVLERENS